jgi:glycine cleavage system H lipoate-binding protein
MYGHVDIRFNPKWQDHIGEILVYLPKVKLNQLVNKDTVLASMETSRCMSTIKAPFKGRVLFVEQTNNPCDLKNKVLFTFKEDEIV